MIRLAVALTLLMLTTPARAESRTFTRLTPDEFRQVLRSWRGTGCTPTKLRAYVEAGRDRYDVTLAWDGRTRWVARHRLSDARFRSLNHELGPKRYVRKSHSRYVVDETVYHAALWVRPRMHPPLPGPGRRRRPPALPVSGEVDPALAPFDELMRSFLRTHAIPGATLAVARYGRLIYARGFGYADLVAREPMQPDTLLRIASISKPVTAAAVLRLVETGKLRLDQPILELLAPQLEPADPRLRQVTVLHLLRHTGGWDRARSFDPMFRPITIAKSLDAPPPAGPEQILRYMFARPLDFDPGARAAYSNFGYSLLGRVIERVSGMSYEAYVRELILEPLGIRGMRLGRTLREHRAPGESIYYTRGNRTGPAVLGPEVGRPVRRPYGAWHLEAMDAHGGWIATASDLLRFAHAFDTQPTTRILSPNSVATVFRRPDGSTGEGAAYYGCGWMVRPIGEAGRANTWHTGALDGTSSLLVRRHDGLSWAVLFNSAETSSGKTPADLIDPALHRAADAVERWPGSER